MIENHADNCDIASEYQQYDIDIGIRRVRESMNKPLPAELKGKIIFRFCDECGNQIDQLRIQKFNSSLCIECQKEQEKQCRIYKR